MWILIFLLKNLNIKLFMQKMSEPIESGTANDLYQP